MSSHLISNLLAKYDAFQGNETFWNADLQPTNILINFMQYLIGCLHRSYIITKEDVDTINNHLICKIYNSEINVKTSINKTFIKLFLQSSIEYNMFSKILNVVQQIILTIINNSKIPNNDKIRALTYQLASFFLLSLADFITYRPSKESDLESRELCIKIFKSFQNVIPLGFAFKDVCVSIVRELCNCIEKYPGIYLILLPHYFQIMKNNNIEMQLIVIESLMKLCKNDVIKQNLVHFFQVNKFKISSISNGQEQSFEITFIEYLYQVAIRNDSINISCALLNLFIHLHSIIDPQQVMNKNMRYDIYAKNLILCDESKDLMKSLIKMMKINEDCIFLTLIEIFNKVNPSNDLIKKIIIFLEVSRRNHLVRLSNIIASTAENNPCRCHRAIQIFKIVNEYCDNSDKCSVLSSIDVVINRCSMNDEAIIAICEFLKSLEIRQFHLGLLSKQKEFIVEIFNAFVQSKSAYALNVIFDVIDLIKIACIQKHLVNDKLRKTLNCCYEEIIDTEALKIAEIQSRPINNTILKKVLMLLDSNLVHFKSYFEYDALITITQQHLNEQTNPNFLEIARLQIVLLKLVFKFMSEEEKSNFIFPMSLEKVVDIVSDLRGKLLNKLRNVKIYENNYEAMLLLTSILEIFYAFHIRPRLNLETQRIIYIRQPRIDQGTFELIITRVNDIIFGASQRLEKEPFSHKIIEILLEFIKNYSYTLDYTVTYKLIYHCFNDNYSSHMVRLLKLLTLKQELFKIIGEAIKVFAGQNETTSNYLRFVTVIKKFLFESQTFVTKPEFKDDIVIYILADLSSFVLKIKGKSENRLLILNMIQKFYGPMDSMVKFKKSIIAQMVYDTVENMKDLNVKERNSCNYFINMLGHI